MSLKLFLEDLLGRPVDCQGGVGPVRRFNRTAPLFVLLAFAACAPRPATTSVYVVAQSERQAALAQGAVERALEHKPEYAVSRIERTGRRIRLISTSPDSQLVAGLPGLLANPPRIRLHPDVARDEPRRRARELFVGPEGLERARHETLDQGGRLVVTVKFAQVDRDLLALFQSSKVVTLCVDGTDEVDQLAVLDWRGPVEVILGASNLELSKDLAFAVEMRDCPQLISGAASE